LEKATTCHTLKREIDFDAFGERKSLAAAGAHEKPTAAAPRAIQLHRLRNVSSGTLAMANELVIGFAKVYHSCMREIASG
jgi:hypothetical protein